MISDSKHCGNGLAAVQLETEHGPIWAISVHLEWPWPFAQSEHIREIVGILDTLSGPKVIGGDFNTVAWAYGVKQIEKASKTRRVGPYLNTFNVEQLGYNIGIDHILAMPPMDGTIEGMPLLGSDHLGVYAKINFGKAE